jgi:hypothetical protein
MRDVVGNDDCCRNCGHCKRPAVSEGVYDRWKGEGAAVICWLQLDGNCRNCWTRSTRIDVNDISGCKSRHVVAR